jgi:hypothetical protein
LNSTVSLLLQDITGVKVTSSGETTSYKVVSTEDVAALDSNDYTYGIMNSADTTGTKIDSLVNAIK